MDSLALSVFQPAAQPEAPAARLNWLDIAAERASDAGAEILVCPELFITGHGGEARQRELACPVLGEYSDRVGEIAHLHGIAIVYGYPERDRDRVFDAAAFVTRDGKVLGHHRKTYLAPGFEAETFARGDRLRVFAFGDWRIALLIGYDLEFPEAARHVARGGADILIVPAATPAGGDFIARMLAPVRAWENGVYIVLADWSGGGEPARFAGQSRVIAPDAAVVAQTGPSEQVLFTTIERARLDAARAHLPYLAEISSGS